MSNTGENGNSGRKKSNLIKWNNGVNGGEIGLKLDLQEKK